CSSDPGTRHDHRRRPRPPRARRARLLAHLPMGPTPERPPRRGARRSVRAGAAQAPPRTAARAAGGRVMRRVGSLFAGYGGLDLAVEQVLDAELAWVSESEDAPSRILAHHWPDVPNLGDIT